MRDEKGDNRDQVACREMTVGEYLDRAIEEARRRADALTELKRSLPSGYLDRGCSTLAAALQV